MKLTGMINMLRWTMFAMPVSLSPALSHKRVRWGKGSLREVYIKYSGTRQHEK